MVNQSGKNVTGEPAEENADPRGDLLLGNGSATLFSDYRTYPEAWQRGASIFDIITNAFHVYQQNTHKESSRAKQRDPADKTKEV